MSFQQTTPFRGAPIDAQRALNIGMGLSAGPLWAAFVASAGLGAAWWWSTAWTRSGKVERLASAPLRLSLQPTVEEAVEQSVDLVEEAIEAGAEVQAAAACDVVEAIDRANSDEPDRLFAATATLNESVAAAVEIAEETLAETGDAASDSIALAVETIGGHADVGSAADGAAGQPLAAASGVAVSGEAGKPAPKPRATPRRKR